jgi:catechol 2,3-dioxygenase-like lactoylglutathione lyase family enzyme
MLAASKLVAFVPTTNPIQARAFYEGVLGLPVVADDPAVAVVFDANGTMLRVTTVPEHRPAPFTVLGWEVENIEAAIEQLTASGVVFLRYPGLNDFDPHAIWTAPGGARIAWFHDPDGNVLSLTQF